MKSIKELKADLSAMIAKSEEACKVYVNLIGRIAYHAPALVRARAAYVDMSNRCAQLRLVVMFLEDPIFAERSGWSTATIVDLIKE
jgi:hypothetical protein